MLLLLILLAFLLYVAALFGWGPLVYAAMAVTVLAGVVFAAWIWLAVTGQIDPFPLCNRRGQR